MCLTRMALALVFPVAVECCPGFPGCFPESCPWLLSLGAVVYTSQSACDELCGQGSARDVHEHGVISVLVGCVSHMMTLKLKLSPVVTYTLSRCVCAIQAEWIGKHH